MAIPITPGAGQAPTVGQAGPWTPYGQPSPADALLQGNPYATWTPGAVNTSGPWGITSSPLASAAWGQVTGGGGGTAPSWGGDASGVTPKATNRNPAGGTSTPPQAPGGSMPQQPHGQRQQRTGGQSMPGPQANQGFGRFQGLLAR